MIQLIVSDEFIEWKMHLIGRSWWIKLLSFTCEQSRILCNVIQGEKEVNVATSEKIWRMINFSFILYIQHIFFELEIFRNSSASNSDSCKRSPQTVTDICWYDHPLSPNGTLQSPFTPPLLSLSQNHLFAKKNLKTSAGMITH